MPYVNIPYVSLTDTLTTTMWNTDIADNMNYIDAVIAGSSVDKIPGSALSAILALAKITIANGTQATNGIALGARFNMVTLNNIMHMTANATFSGSVWSCIDTAKAAWCIRFGVDDAGGADNFTILRKAATAGTWTAWDSTLSYDNAGNLTIPGTLNTTGNVNLGNNSALTVKDGLGTNVLTLSNNGTTNLAAFNNASSGGAMQFFAGNGQGFSGTASVFTLFQSGSAALLDIRASGALYGRGIARLAEFTIAGNASLLVNHGLPVRPMLVSGQWGLSSGSENATCVYFYNSANVPAGEVAISYYNATQVNIINKQAGTVYVTLLCVI